jgi:hypothetical protein
MEKGGRMTFIKIGNHLINPKNTSHITMGEYKITIYMTGGSEGGYEMFSPDSISFSGDKYDIASLRQKLMDTFVIIDFEGKS